jgi:formamidopyrimidine-DNA glycosylase
MPELPDVEHFRDYLQETSLNQKISSVQVKDNRILKDVDQSSLRRLLVDNRFTETFRYGKNIFLRIDKDPWLTLHFGMTGDLKYYSKPSDKPPFERLSIVFSNGSTLGYSDQRLFGRIGVTSSPEDFISEHHLGKDALEIDKDGFLKVLSGKRRSIKSLLMDQGLIAGIGNEYSDEILFQAGILPQRGSDSLKREDFLKIFNSMKMVLKTALKAHGDKKRFPESFLLRNRRKGAKCPGCNTAMESFRLGGRTGYFCPGCQV